MEQTPPVFFHSTRLPFHPPFRSACAFPVRPRFSTPPAVPILPPLCHSTRGPRFSILRAFHSARAFPFCLSILPFRSAHVCCTLACWKLDGHKAHDGLRLGG